MFRKFKKPTPAKAEDTGTVFVRNLREKLSEDHQYDEYFANDDDDVEPDCTGIYVTEYQCPGDMPDEDQSVIMDLKDTHRLHLKTMVDDTRKRNLSRTVDGMAFDTVRVKALKLVDE